MEKKEFKMTQVFAMWLKESKDGLKYLSGKTEDGQFLTGFFNGKKQNPKEPDVRIYFSGEQGEKLKEYTSLWVNVSKNDKKYLSGKVGEMRVVGFINDKVEAGGKRPYFSVYESDSTPEAKQEEVVLPSDLPF